MAKIALKIVFKLKRFSHKIIDLKSVLEGTRFSEAPIHPRPCFCRSWDIEPPTTGDNMLTDNAELGSSDEELMLLFDEPDVEDCVESAAEVRA